GSFCRGHTCRPVLERDASGWRAGANRPDHQDSPGASTLLDALRRLLLHEAEEVAGHSSHLDLLAAFGDPVATVVAVDVLEGHVARVTEAAVNLHGSVGGLAAQPVGPEVAHGDLVRLGEGAV